MTREEIEKHIKALKQHRDSLKSVEGGRVERINKDIAFHELALDGLRWRKTKQGATEQAYKKLQELKD